MKPVRCPVCNGSGSVKQEAALEVSADYVGEISVTCHGCGGRGWVEVSEVDECAIVPRPEETD